METKHVVLGVDQTPVYSRIATHPGEVLKHEIEERKLVKIDAAQTLGIQPGNLSELFKGKRNISPVLALKLHQLLGTPSASYSSLSEVSKLRRFKIGVSDS